MSTTPLAGNSAVPLTHQEHMCNGIPGHKTKVNSGTMVWQSPEAEETLSSFIPEIDSIQSHRSGGPLALNTADFQYSEWFVSASPVYVGFDLLRSVSERSHAAFLPLFTVHGDCVRYVRNSLGFGMFSSPWWFSLNLPQLNDFNFVIRIVLVFELLFEKLQMDIQRQPLQIWLLKGR